MFFYFYNNVCTFMTFCIIFYFFGGIFDQLLNCSQQLNSYVGNRTVGNIYNRQYFFMLHMLPTVRCVWVFLILFLPSYQTDWRCSDSWDWKTGSCARIVGCFCYQMTGWLTMVMTSWRESPVDSSDGHLNCCHLLRTRKRMLYVYLTKNVIF